jgi:hypothetical protein
MSQYQPDRDVGFISKVRLHGLPPVENPTSVNSQNTTFELGIYNKLIDNKDYVK